LARLRDLLVRSGDRDWAETVSNALEIRDDAVLAHTAQGWFADMGGLNGLVLLPGSGHRVAGCAVDATNRAFVALRGDVFRLSHAIAAADSVSRNHRDMADRR
jgi:hypothetical protein